MYIFIYVSYVLFVSCEFAAVFLAKRLCFLFLLHQNQHGNLMILVEIRQTIGIVLCRGVWC